MLEHYIIAYFVVENVIQYSLNIYNLSQLFCPRTREREEEETWNGYYVGEEAPSHSRLIRKIGI